MEASHSSWIRSEHQYTRKREQETDLNHCKMVHSSHYKVKDVNLEKMRIYSPVLEMPVSIRALSAIVRETNTIDIRIEKMKVMTMQIQSKRTKTCSFKF